MNVLHCEFNDDTACVEIIFTDAMKEKLSKIQVEALEQINAPDANLEEIKIKYLGKKGELTA